MLRVTRTRIREPTVHPPSPPDTPSLPRLTTPSHKLLLRCTPARSSAAPRRRPGRGPLLTVASPSPYRLAGRAHHCRLEDVTVPSQQPASPKGVSSIRSLPACFYARALRMRQKFIRNYTISCKSIHKSTESATKIIITAVDELKQLYCGAGSAINRLNKIEMQLPTAGYSTVSETYKFLRFFIDHV